MHDYGDDLLRMEAIGGVPYANRHIDRMFLDDMYLDSGVHHLIART